MSASQANGRRILVTGAAGRIGTAFRHFAGDRYELRLAVHHRGIEEPGPHEVVRLDVADPESSQAACQGMDMVVHMAADPKPSADFYGSLLDNNLKGPYNILQAARDQGCQRVILASSVQVVDGYPVDVQVRPDMPIWPTNCYGAAKGFVEAVARSFASQGLSTVVIRVGTFEASWLTTKMVNPYRLSKFISRRDMSHLLVRSIETPGIEFALLHGVSNNRFKRLDITSTREQVGYDPQDDAFELFRATLATGDLWCK